MTSFFTYAQAAKWRIFNQLDRWSITDPPSEKGRRLLLTLQPPFVFENEVLIFGTQIASGWLAPETCIAEFNHNDLTLKAGHSFATDSRLIAYNRDKGQITQVFYQDIRAVYTKNARFALLLANRSYVVIDVQVPHASILKFIGGFSASPLQKQLIINEMK